MILGLTSNSYRNAITSYLGKGSQHALLIYQNWMRHGKIYYDLLHFNNAQALLAEIIGLTDFSFPLQHVTTIQEEATEKFIFRTHDGHEIETVLIPMQGRMTLCISSQVGCRMGCRFCETAKMGLVRHLSCAEIVAQVFFIQQGRKQNVRNLVFMGMGEPLDNFEEVMRAVDILCDPHGFGFGPGRITISTSGAVDPLYRFIREGRKNVKLAVSINAPTDAIRTRLMPVNRKNSMADLKSALILYCKETQKNIFIEYVMIKGINDSLEHADQLAHYLCDLSVTVNLIPYNPQRKSLFQPSNLEDIARFATQLKTHALKVFTRAKKGQSIMAACGQLGNRKLDLQALCC